MGEPLSLADPFTVPTQHWHRCDDGRVQCDVCPRACRLQKGQRGLLRAGQGRRPGGARDADGCMGVLLRDGQYHYPNCDAYTETDGARALSGFELTVATDDDHYTAEDGVAVLVAACNRRDVPLRQAFPQKEWLSLEARHQQIPRSDLEYRRLLAWLRSHGPLHKVGVEGTGSYGSALARHLAVEGVDVVEVARPNRRVRRRHGKNDVVDAIAAARAVLSGEATATPRSHDGAVEALRTLKVVQRSANKSRTQTMNQLRNLLVTAPDNLRDRLRGLPPRQLLTTCAAFRVAADDDSLAAITRLSMRQLARRVLLLDDELKTIRTRLQRITTRTAPDLIALHGAGPDTASTLLVTAGDNAHRLDREQSFASLTGSSPLDASSGKRQRHRLNRGGDRQANAALWRIAMVRLATDQRTRDYVDKRLAEGKTKTEAIRCLKRYIAREVFNALPREALV